MFNDQSSLQEGSRMIGPRKQNIIRDSLKGRSIHISQKANWSKRNCTLNERLRCVLTANSFLTLRIVKQDTVQSKPRSYRDQCLRRIRSLLFQQTEAKKKKAQNHLGKLFQLMLSRLIIEWVSLVKALDSPNMYVPVGPTL